MPRNTTPGAPDGASIDHHLAPRRVLARALDRRAASEPATPIGLDTFTFLYRRDASVQKDGVQVGKVRFWADRLRAFTSIAAKERKSQVWYDAAAADRGHLTEVYFIVDPQRLEQYPPIRCEPRAYAQSARDRTEESAAQRAHLDDLRAQLDEAKVGSARRKGGHAAAGRQADINVKRDVQGRAGQEHSGFKAPLPEVAKGIEDAKRERLRRRAKVAFPDWRTETDEAPKTKARGAKGTRSRSTANPKEKSGYTPTDAWAKAAEGPRKAADSNPRKSSTSR